MINDHIIHYTDLPTVRVGFNQEQDKALKLLCDKATTVVDVDKLELKTVTNISEFRTLCQSQEPTSNPKGRKGVC